MSSFPPGSLTQTLLPWMRTEILMVRFVLASLTAGTVNATPIPDFESEVAPILITRCLECHEGKDPSGGLSLTSANGLLQGGESGPAMDLEQAHESLLLRRLHQGDMPPPKQGEPQRLPPEEITLLERWLQQGAPWPAERVLDPFERTTAYRAGRDWWSLQPVVRPPIPPAAPASTSPHHAVDRFIHARLAKAGISPAPPADRPALLKRAHHTLTGLPPTLAEIQAFERDPGPQAWEKRLDRLLASPHYGERWGRHWLDVARYADTSGYERDQEKPFAWKYRDWVVQAFNEDLPYHQFILHQLAGDEISRSTEAAVIATGFLRLGAWNDEPNDPADYQYDRLEELVHTTSSAFLGLTVKCARCHTHKFDPITQEDYYRMASAFWAGPVPVGPPTGPLGGPTVEALGHENVLGWTDTTVSPPPLHVLKNGERHRPLHEVIPASLSTIPSLERPFTPPPPQARTSHRRLQLARWIADPAHPLTGRVFINRLWQHHFGQGLVRTPNNFGFLADPPTHPDLLDWLADEFRLQGGHLKPLHRLLLTSATWKQSSVHPQGPEIEGQDPGNRLWWRASRQRRDAESLRDALLEASGELDLTMGGPGFRPTLSKAALEGLSRKSGAWQASPPEAQRRRGLYTFLKRGLLPPLMTTFDLSDPTQPCGQRDVTIVPTQALALLNNPFVHDRSEALAAGIIQTAPTLDARIEMAWSRILKRAPTHEERHRARDHVRHQLTRFLELEQPQGLALPNKRSPAPDPAAALTFHFRADQAEREGASSHVIRVSDLSGHGHHARQMDDKARPRWTAHGLNGHPAIVFDGKDDFLHLEGSLLRHDRTTLVCVVTDEGGPGHREILSNWNGAAGNATTSLFLGLTESHTLRFSDAFAPAGQITQPHQPFMLTATNAAEGATLYQNGRLLNQGPSLAPRRLDTPWVIGQQGNIGGEYWKGAIAEIRVYDRPLSKPERHAVERALAKRYGLEWSGETPPPAPSPGVLALASLCHVLMNSNEFLYLD